ncbi:MAG: class I SAM-dependent methyltransferase, partial [Chloroflexota bacterium]
MSDDAYRNFAKWYDRLFEPMNSGLRKLGFKLYRPSAEMKVLDVGCGTGIHLEYYLKAGCKIFGIDPSEAMLGLARARLGQDAKLQHGSATEMPYQDGQFDLVYCMLALHEMDPDIRTEVAAEMKRVVKSDGRILWIDFHTGSIQGIKGWLTQVFIFLSELAAGRKHFANSRQFLRTGGLRTLIDAQQLEIDKEVIVG